MNQITGIGNWNSSKFELRGQVRELAVNFDDSKKKLVEAWMTKVEKGDVAEDPSQVLDECEVSSLMGGARSRECFEFEDALRGYKAAADLWLTQA